MAPTAQQIMDTLGLKAHPTCGLVIETMVQDRWTRDPGDTGLWTESH